jgi:hypothetical protein
VGVVEDERSGAPERAPARGERRGARGVLDGEEGDDAEEERVRERADEVLIGAATGGGEVGGEDDLGGHGRVGDAGGKEVGRDVHDRVHQMRPHAVSRRQDQHLILIHGSQGRRRLIHGGRRAPDRNERGLNWNLALGIPVG